MGALAPDPSAAFVRGRDGIRGLGGGTLLRLLGDHLVLDLGVGCFRHDLLPDQIVLPRVWPALNDLLGESLADAWQLHQIVF